MGVPPVRHAPARLGALSWVTAARRHDFHVGTPITSAAERRRGFAAPSATKMPAFQFLRVPELAVDYPPACGSHNAKRRVSTASLSYEPAILARSSA